MWAWMKQFNDAVCGVMNEVWFNCSFCCIHTINAIAVVLLDISWNYLKLSVTSLLLCNISRIHTIDDTIVLYCSAS